MILTVEMNYVVYRPDRVRTPLRPLSGREKCAPTHKGRTIVRPYKDFKITLLACQEKCPSSGVADRLKVFKPFSMIPVAHTRIGNEVPI